MNIETINDSYAKAIARIAELEAEREHAVYAYVSTRIEELEAERDRFKAALTEIGGMGDVGLNIGPAIRTARAALSGEGVTT